jgi:hypothetical protein
VRVVDNSHPVRFGVPHPKLYRAWQLRLLVVCRLILGRQSH